MAPMKIEPKSEHNLDGYGAPLIPWSKIRDRLDQGFTQEPEKGGPNRHTCWLTTVRPDGRPHVMPLAIPRHTAHHGALSQRGSKKYSGTK